MKIRYCTRCVTPNTRPRISFDEDGVCSACTYADAKKRTDWKAKKEELQEIAGRFRSRTGAYDCIVPGSGGKDSSFQAYYAKEVLGLNPLCVTFVPTLPNPTGSRNMRNMVERVGVDHIAVTPNPEVHRRLSRIMFEEHGNVFLPWIQGIFSAATQLAVEKQIPLILYGENGEAEYGGDSQTRAGKSLDEGGIRLRMKSDRHNWKDPENWTSYGFRPNQLLPYVLPPQSAQSAVGITRVFLGDYIPWNNNHNLHVALNVIRGFSTLARRTVGTYTHGSSIDDDIDEFYLWFLWVKFGFGRASKSASPDIREGKLTRAGAVELVRLYDGEFPWYVFDPTLAYLGMTEEEFFAVVRRFVGDQDNLDRERREILDSGASAEEAGNKIPAWRKVGEDRWVHAQTVHGDERVLDLSMKRPENWDRPGGDSSYARPKELA